MYILDITFGTPEHDEMVQLRTDILRKPLGLTFSEAQLAAEHSDVLVGAYDRDFCLQGCLILSPQNDTDLKMRQVAVAKAAQGHGYGRALVAWSEAFARDKGYANMVLNARLTAVPFYEKLAYQIEGDLFEEVGIPHYKMVKKL